jgi:hypothetical protein
MGELVVVPDPLCWVYGIATHDTDVGAHDVGSHSMGIPDISWTAGGVGGAAEEILVCLCVWSDIRAGAIHLWSVASSTNHGADDRGGRVGERLETGHRRTAPLDRAIILLNDVVGGCANDVPPTGMLSGQQVIRDRTWRT